MEGVCSRGGEPASKEQAVAAAMAVEGGSFPEPLLLICLQRRPPVSSTPFLRRPLQSSFRRRQRSTEAARACCTVVLQATLVGEASTTLVAELVAPLVQASLLAIVEGEGLQGQGQEEGILWTSPHCTGSTSN